MTVTNAAATVARHSKIDIKASALDFGLYSIVVIKIQGKSSVKPIVPPSSLRGWLESSPSGGDRWLGSAAQDGDLYATETLGRRLLTGGGLPKSIEEGLGWLKKSAGLTNSWLLQPVSQN